jgi:hypothetical protein
MTGNERSKAPLALMEQIIMILVFALASAVCLQAFVYADRLSRNGEQSHMAMTKAQQAAEYCKANRGDLDRVCGALAAERTKDGLTAVYPEEDMVLSLVLTEDTAYVQKAKVSVADPEGKEIYAIEIAWQKEGQS